MPLPGECDAGTGHRLARSAGVLTPKRPDANKRGNDNDDRSRFRRHRPSDARGLESRDTAATQARARSGRSACIRSRIRSGQAAGGDQALATTPPPPLQRRGTAEKSGPEVGEAHCPGPDMPHSFATGAHRSILTPNQRGASSCRGPQPPYTFQPTSTYGQRRAQDQPQEGKALGVTFRPCSSA